MSVIVSIIDGLRKDTDTGLGGANEGHIEGFIDDMIEGVAGGVRDLTNGELLVTQNSPAAMTVLLANGVAYVPQTTYDASIITKTKFWRVVVKDQTALTIGANSSGSTRIDLICVKVDKTIEPNEYASNVATIVVVAGTPGAGVPATPSDHYKLAEITVTNGETAINTADITDRRVQLQLKDEFTSRYYASDAGGDDTYAATIEGISSYAQILGKQIALKVATANTGAASLNINGLGAVAIKNGGTTDVATGDILANTVVLLSHDGTNFQLLNPKSSGTSLTKASQTETNTGTDDTNYLTPLKVRASIDHNYPRGFLINGKISVTVATNDLTVAIKTLAGTDPSASDPVYIRIGDAVRTITAALSVTKNDGTNWCNAGSAELATQEIDYFVYLGYNATDGVVIGFSRIPYANQYSEFSATTTNERYAAISTIANAASTDNYELIGRFAATLSAGAGYTWTVPTFTAINLIQKPIYETRWLSWQPVYSSEGTMTFTQTVAYQITYRINGRSCEFNIGVGGTTASGPNNSIYFTLPIGMIDSDNNAMGVGYGTYDGAYAAGFGTNIGQNQFRATKYSAANWGIGAGREFYGGTVYRIA